MFKSIRLLSDPKEETRVFQVDDTVHPFILIMKGDNRYFNKGDTFIQKAAVFFQLCKIYQELDFNVPLNMARYFQFLSKDKFIASYYKDAAEILWFMNNVWGSNSFLITYHSCIKRYLERNNILQ